MSPEPSLTGPLVYNLYLKSDLARVAAAFEVRGIPWLLIKGLALAESLYGGIAFRPMVDNDVVVRPVDVTRAHEELRRLGFVDRERNQLELNLGADFQHPMHFEHPNVHTGLELHWQLHPPELFHSDVHEYFASAIDGRCGEFQYRTLCANHRLVHLVTHWVQHGLNKPSILRDIERAWHAGVSSNDASNAFEVQAVARFAERIGAFDAMCLALLLLQRQGRLQNAAPHSLRSKRAEWFAWAYSDVLKLITHTALDGAAERRLRLASWALLTPKHACSAVSREIWPTRARLSRIVGRPLSRTEAVSVFFSRQRRATAKLFGA